MTPDPAHPHSPSLGSTSPLGRGLRGQARGLGLAMSPGWALGWALVGALTACGGGSGSGDGVDSGGTGMTITLAQGPISGFGSVVVAGVHYDETQARITDDDGRTLAASDLKLGMLATVEADQVVQAGALQTAVARTVRVGEQVLGPISAVDPVGCSAMVLGQRVMAVAATVVDASLPAAVGSCRLSGLSAGQLLAAHGTWDVAQGRLVATRVERPSAAAAYVLRAPVTHYNPAGASLTLGGLTVSLAELASASLPAALPVGSIARVRLRTTPIAGSWSAIGLDNATLAVADGNQIELEGRISAFTSAQQFSVDGVAVDASTARFSPAGGSALALGVKVEVEGPVVGGRVIARSVQYEVDDDLEIEPLEVEGRITALDVAAQTFVVRGVTISYAQSPQLEGGALSDLAVGRKVSVKGQMSSDGAVLVASQLHIESDD